MWKEENGLRLAAECELRNIRAGKEAHHAFVVKSLNNFYVVANELRQRGNSISLADLLSWTTEVTAAENDMILWVNSNMGAAAVTKLKDMSAPMVVLNGINDDHKNALTGLIKVSANLIALQQPEWDQFAPEKPSDCH